MPPPAATVSAEIAAGLERDLRRSVHGEVHFDRLHRALYATDASLYEIAPAGVVLPRDAADVVAAVNLCRAHGVPIVARGAGTGIAGGAVGWGVQLDFSRFMHAIGPINPAARTVRVQPGVVLDDLNAAAARHGLHFPADVATASRATLGGMIANNSCGSHSVYYGRTVDHVESLTVVLSDGSVVEWAHHPYAELPPTNGQPVQTPTYLQSGLSFRSPHPPGGDHSARTICETQTRIEAALDHIRVDARADVLARYPRVLRRNGGYALDRLCQSDRVNPATILCGSEGTLGLVVEATLRLVPLPRCKALAVLHFDRILDAVAAAPQLLAHRPAAVELIDHLILTAGIPTVPADQLSHFLLGSPRGILVCELYDDEPDRLRQRMAALESDIAARRLGTATRVVFDPAIQLAVWTLRNKGFGLLMSRPGDSHPYEFIEDAAVDPAHLHDYIADLDTMLQSEGVTDVGYYAHASVGVLHVRPTLNLKKRDDVARMRRIAEKTADLVLKYGGALTGEHGDGVVRSEWLTRMYGPRIVEAFRAVKQAFDPHDLFNPRKIVDPLPMDERLRYAARPRTIALPTVFDYSTHGDMTGLVNMCSGVGQCRQKLVGTMCPSYMATLDERHSTRGRALALRAALTDTGLLDGLDDPALDEVMDLCLSCKACKSECPTGVDMARLKAEWLHHRNTIRGTPPSARFLAAAPRLAALGSLAPALANAVAQSPAARGLLERLFGVDRRIAPPLFAPRTFRAWFAARRPSPPGRRGRVVYFVDTWMNHYWPEVGMSAVALLEAAGYEVLAPTLACCGRPAISKGLLDVAVAAARDNVDRLSAHADAGNWIVGSEPSCILTFVDEVPHFVRTPAAKRVAARVRTVESLLADTLRTTPNAIRWSSNPRAVDTPVLASSRARRVLLHGHCHQKALIGTADALALLRAIPHCDAREINSGCCGMAGSFGHETAHHDVARAVGEQRLFPAVRDRGDATIAVCGFSCREQITHHTDARPAHVLELAAEALATPGTSGA